ncbi:MAG: hypothetical protein CMM48_04725 [Rhodospirillaceae bacterium]|nr:hypothetical protein [Rhodospirillaceae bacterium]HAA93885.1 hypothetical protein [Rhodospirillaceae bacterium]
MSDQDDKDSVLARARDYPYWAPAQSYVWDPDDDPRDLQPFDPELIEGRWPVLAVGSNRSPEQLARKYNGTGAEPIAVQYARLADFDVVYAAHISQYGAVPAMLQHAPGVKVKLAVTWLDDDQLQIMHETEGNYDFGEIEQVQLVLERGEPLEAVYLYVGRQGSLTLDGAATGLEAVVAADRPYGSATTANMLETLRQKLGASEDPDAFVQRLVADEAFRHAIIQIIGAKATPFSYPVNILEADLGTI